MTLKHLGVGPGLSPIAKTAVLRLNAHMQQQNTSAPRSELVRPLEDRMVAGVAIAFANRLSIPVWVVRVLFIVGTVTGGLGLVLYVACWAVLRSEDEDEPPAARFFSRANSTQSWMGIALIFLAA